MTDSASSQSEVDKPGWLILTDGSIICNICISIMTGIISCLLMQMELIEESDLSSSPLLFIPHALLDLCAVHLSNISFCV